MSYADLLGFMLALAIVCVAIALVINGVRNALHAYTLLRVTVLQRRIARVTDEILPAHAGQLVAHAGQLDAHDARIDGVAARTESIGRILAALIEEMTEELDLSRTRRAAANATGPGDSSSPGPGDHTSPPAVSRDSEGKA